MQPFTICLPGSGKPTPMFRFGYGQGLPQRLMNLPLLGTEGDNAPGQTEHILEQWSAPGPVTRFVDQSIQGVRAAHFQLLSLNVELGQQSIRQLTQRLYTQLLSNITGSDFPQLVRCWNYIPAINAGAGDAENYRQFCWGRADAFAEQPLQLPAATAIGSHDGWLRVSILSTSTDSQVQHIENPRQISAYDYPRQYGPRSPSFARATLLQRDNAPLLLLSGTSSIVQHQTLHEGNLSAQVAETKRNIDHLLAHAGFSAHQLKPTAMRFYLRNPNLLTDALQAYQHHFTGFPDAHFLLADICRADLALEVEGVFAPV